MKYALGRGLPPAMRWQVMALLVACLAGVVGLVTGHWWAASTTAAQVSPVKSATATELAPPGALRGDDPAGARTVSRRIGAGGAPEDAMWEATSRAEPAINPGSGATLPEGWRFGGFFATEKGPAAIVVFDGATPPLYMYVGDRLPNKASITAIEPDAVTVRTLINKRWVLVTLDL